MPEAAVEISQGIAHIATHPQETYQVLKSLLSSDDIFNTLSTAVKQGYIQRLETLRTEYERAGAEGAFKAGKEFGKLALDVGGIIGGAAGLAKGMTKLTQKLGAVAVKGGIATASKSVAATNFFDGTHYTAKVKYQMSLMDFHAFPESVESFAKYGKVSELFGKDGIKRFKLEVPGTYRGRSGTFEYIKESDGAINHRLFIQDK